MRRVAITYTRPDKSAVPRALAEAINAAFLARTAAIDFAEATGEKRSVKGADTEKPTVDGQQLQRVVAVLEQSSAVKG